MRPALQSPDFKGKGAGAMGEMVKPLCMIVMVSVYCVSMVIVVRCMKEITSTTINKICRLAEAAEKEESED